MSSPHSRPLPPSSTAPGWAGTFDLGGAEFNLYEGDQVELRTWLGAGMLDFVVTYDIGEE